MSVKKKGDRQTSLPPEKSQAKKRGVFVALDAKQLEQLGAPGLADLLNTVRHEARRKKK